MWFCRDSGFQVLSLIIFVVVKKISDRENIRLEFPLGNYFLLESLWMEIFVNMLISSKRWRKSLLEIATGFLSFLSFLFWVFFSEFLFLLLHQSSKNNFWKQKFPWQGACSEFKWSECGVCYWQWNLFWSFFKSSTSRLERRSYCKSVF